MTTEAARSGARRQGRTGPAEHQRRGVLVFLLIAFGLAWAGIIGADQVLGGSLDNPLVQLPLAFSPAIAAVVVRLWVTREGFRDAGLAPRLRSAKRYYLAAWLGPLLVLAGTIAPAAALGLYTPDLASLRALVTGTQPLMWLGIPVLTIPIFWGEEFGWRSYLQQRVAARPVPAAIITGLIWAAWHYPLAITDYAGEVNPFSWIAVMTLQAVPLAIILAWLMLRARNVWVACLAHAGNNLVLGDISEILLIDQGGLDPSTVGLLQFVPLCAIALWIVLSGRLATDGEPRQPRRGGAGVAIRLLVIPVLAASVILPSATAASADEATADQPVDPAQVRAFFDEARAHTAVCTALAWRQGWWNRRARIHYTVVATGAAMFIAVAHTYQFVFRPLG